MRCYSVAMVNSSAEIEQQIVCCLRMDAVFSVSHRFRFKNPPVQLLIFRLLILVIVVIVIVDFLDDARDATQLDLDGELVLQILKDFDGILVKSLKSAYEALQLEYSVLKVKEES